MDTRCTALRRFAPSVLRFLCICCWLAAVPSALFAEEGTQDAATTDGERSVLPTTPEPDDEELVATEPQSVLPLCRDPDFEYAETIRQWMSGRGLGGDGATTETEESRADDASDLWIAYISIPRDLGPDEREQRLDALLKLSVPDALRHVVLEDIASDRAFQSRRAEFIRRYGFYSNWFNRFAYTGSRMLQGNVQAGAQLVVDGVFDLVGRQEMTAAERKFARILRELDREGRSSEKDRKKLEKLERRLASALADLDAERAGWSLEQGNPDAAIFYAQSALVQEPGNDDARRAEREALREVAARNRRRIASNQVGYADRAPPVKRNSPAHLRAAISGRSSDLADILEANRASELNAGGPHAEPPGATPEALDEGEEFLLRMLATLPAQDESAIIAMRRWAEELKDEGFDPPVESLWLQRLLGDPEFNPELRLARAQAARRGNLTRFILVGPDGARERTYTFASRTTAAVNALGSVGIFYGFEVLYRAGIVVFFRPPPAEEGLDSAAAFLRAAPQDRDSRRVARWLAEQYIDAGRFDGAKAVLKRYGELDVERMEELLEDEASRTVRSAKTRAYHDPRRAPMLRHAIELAPQSSAARKAKKALAKAPPRPQPIVAEVDWNSFGAWVKAPLPAWLPGETDWFDGQAENGEVEDNGEKGFLIAAEGAAPEEVTISYSMRLATGKRKRIERSMLLSELEPFQVAWIAHQLQDRVRARRSASRLVRPRIPYSVVGGVGLSGLDFYPKLRPIEEDTADLYLYRDAPVSD